MELLLQFASLALLERSIGSANLWEEVRESVPGAGDLWRAIGTTPGVETYWRNIAATLVAGADALALLTLGVVDFGFGALAWVCCVRKTYNMSPFAWWKPRGSANLMWACCAYICRSFGTQTDAKMVWRN